MRDRNVLYDRAKGIGITLVVLGHLFTYGSYPFAVIFSFHMPLFFFVSGVLFNPTEGLKNMTIKIITRCLFPFVFFTVLGFLVKLIFFSGGVSFKVLIYETFWNIGADSIMMGALWFLGILALSFMALSCIINCRINKARYWLVFVVLSILAVVAEKIPFAIPFRMKTLFAAILFVWLGYILKDKILVFLKHKNVKYYFFLLGVIFLYISYLNKTVNIAIPVYNNFIFYLISAFLGIFLTFVISQWRWLVFFDFFGKNSLYIFATHAIWIKVYTLIIGNIFNCHYEAMINIPYPLCIIGTIFVICLSIPTIYIVKPFYNLIYKRFTQLIF